MPERSRLGALALLIVLVLGGTWPYFENWLDANERPRLLAGIALVEQGSVRVDGPHAFGLALGPDLARAEDNSLVPNKPPGSTLVASAAWLLLEGRNAIFGSGIDRRAHTILARALGALLPTLLLALALWRREAKTGEDPAHFEFALIIWLLATPAWANAKLLFGHSLAAALLASGLLLLTSTTGLDRRRALLGGLACASAVTVEYTALFAGPAIAVWLLVHHRRRHDLLLAASLGALGPIAMLAAYHRALFGSIWLTGYHRAADPGFAEIHGRGLLGLQLPTTNSLWEHLASPWGGALVWCPLALLGLLAGVWAAKRAEDPRERSRQALFAAVGLSLFAVLLGLEQGGGWRVGPRYAVIALPLALPGLTVLVRELAHPGERRGLGFVLLLGLFGSSLVIEFLAANWFPHLIPHGNPVGDLLIPLAFAGARVHGLPPILMVVTTAGLVGMVLVRLGRASEHGPAVWVAGLGLALGLTLAHALVPPSDPGAEHELAAIESLLAEEASGPPSTRLK